MNAQRAALGLLVKLGWSCEGWTTLPGDKGYVLTSADAGVPERAPRWSVGPSKSLCLDGFIALDVAITTYKDGSAMLSPVQGDDIVRDVASYLNAKLAYAMANAKHCKAHRLCTDCNPCACRCEGCTLTPTGNA